MRKLYWSYRKEGASHWEAITCMILTPIVIMGAFALFTTLFFGLGCFSALVKGL